MTTAEVHFKHPDELPKLLGKVNAQVSRLFIKHGSEQEETPEKTDENSIDLNGPFDKFINLDSLHIKAHIFAPIIRLQSLRELSLDGSIALAELNLPSCVILALSIMGDRHGVACDIDAFAPLFGNTGLPNLLSLDLRHLC